MLAHTALLKDKALRDVRDVRSCGWEQKANYFGEHQGITCDGCGCIPIIGYRYRCRKCPNHDICENCHERWDHGNGSMANGLAKQTISLDPKDHDFFVHKERGFKPLVKTQGATQKSEKKLKVGRWDGMGWGGVGAALLDGTPA